MATVAAGPVFRLLGARDTGVAEDYRVAKMPPVQTGLLDGELAWRQHDGGHEDRSNMSFFIALGESAAPLHAALRCPRPSRGCAATTTPTSPTSSSWPRRRAGGIDVYFLGDSITRRWGATDYPDFLANWNQNFHGWNAGNFGWGGDRTQNILWRLENGELDGVNPKVIVLLAGTNNVGKEAGDDAKVADVTRGPEGDRRPLPEEGARGHDRPDRDLPAQRQPRAKLAIDRINANLVKLADGKSVRFLDVNAGLADGKGTLVPGVMGDRLHLSLKGYQVWADGLKPVLTELLGPPAADRPRSSAHG